MARKEGVNYRLNLIINAIVVLFFALFPLTGSSYHVILISKIMTFAILAMSLDLMWGYTGIFSFGHSAFFGLGAYSLGLLLKHTDSAGLTYVGLTLSVVAPMGIALALGYFIFYGKVSGVYFGLITLAFTSILQQIFITLIKYTGGDNGLYGFPYPELRLPGEVVLSLENEYILYYFIFVSLIVLYLISRAIVNSSFGRVMKGIKDNEGRMEFFGYSVAFCKLVVFAISAGMAGYAGALFVPVSFVSPSIFSLLVSTQILIWVAVGGRGTLIGGMVGAFSLNYLEAILSSSFVNVWLLLISVILISSVLFWPQGIMGFLKEKYGTTFLG
jgi:urea ABC transporter permease protein UrtC